MPQPITESTSAPPKAPTPVGAQSRFSAWVPALLLVLMTLLAYQPVWHAGYVWDDDAYVTQNRMLTAPDGWRQIWFSAHWQSQYFPLVYTTLRFERALWGLDPRGYHAVNVLLHALNALLLWQLLRRLALRGAWFAAAIFALHPVQVESVAWIAELKNVQSTLFYLLALLAWVEQLKIREPAPINRGQDLKIYYGLALIFYVLALFSKTTACTLPAAMVLIWWWRREAIGWRRLLQILPFVLLGAVMGLVSVWWEKHLGNYSRPGVGVDLGFTGRWLIATRAVWFYAAKLFWPVNLTFSYPRWEINPRAPWQYLGIVGCALFALLLWWRRRAIGRGVAAGVLFFVAALLPMLGFIPLYTFRFSFVADHYQYLACAGLIIPFAALISNAMTSGRLGRVPGFCLSAGLLGVLGVLTWKQAHLYAGPEALWSDTLAKNPASWLAHDNLGVLLDNQRQTDAAISHYREAIRIEPEAFEPHHNLGAALYSEGHLDEALDQLQEALRLKSDDPGIHNDLGNVLDAKGRTAEAISHYEQAIRLNPDDPEAHSNLGAAFGKQGDVDGAIAQLREALRLNPDDPLTHYNLAMTFVSKGNTNEAILQLQEALRLKPDFAEARSQLSGVLQTVSAPAGR